MQAGGADQGAWAGWAGRKGERLRLPLLLLLLLFVLPGLRLLLIEASPASPAPSSPQVNRTKWCNRFYPVEHTCYASMEKIEELAAEVAAQHFPANAAEGIEVGWRLACCASGAFCESATACRCQL